MSTMPHDYCIHHTEPFVCSIECPACAVEPLAEYHNRLEVAAEGGGDDVVREVRCFVSEWESWSERELAKIKHEEAA